MTRSWNMSIRFHSWSLGCSCSSLSIGLPVGSFAVAPDLRTYESSDEILAYPPSEATSPDRAIVGSPRRLKFCAGSIPAASISRRDLAGPSADDLSTAAGTRQPHARRGDRPGNRPRDDRRGARAHGAVRAEAASPLRPLRRPLAVPLSRGTREGDARRCRAARLEPAIARDPKGPRPRARGPEKGRTAGLTSSLRPSPGS